jgi:hypothetical protein
MARAKKLQLGKNYILFSVIGLIGLGGFSFLHLGSPQKFAQLSEFPVENYLEKNGIIGKEDFRLEGKVENILLRSDNGNTFLLSIKPANSDYLLPVILTSQKKSIQREQILVMKVHADSSEVIKCDDYDLK